MWGCDNLCSLTYLHREQRRTEEVRTVRCVEHMTRAFPSESTRLMVTRGEIGEILRLDEPI